MTISEIYFWDQSYLPNVDTDFIQLVQSTYTINKNSREKHTSIIRLDTEDSYIFSNMHKKYRNEIRRVQKDQSNFSYDLMLNPSKEMLTEFQLRYDTFSKKVKITSFNHARARQLLKKNALFLSKLMFGDGNWIYHCYACDSSRARLLYSVSDYSVGKNDQNYSKMAMLNKYMHWLDIIEFKDKGFLIYDFGGISKDGSLKNIDDFKRKFGGIDIIEYNTIHARSTLGKFMYHAGGRYFI